MSCISNCRTSAQKNLTNFLDRVTIKNEKTKDICRSTIKVTAFVVTLLAVIVAVYASFGAFKMLPAQAPFRAIGTIGQYWSGVATVISVGGLLVTARAVLDLTTQKCSKKKEASKVASPAKVESAKEAEKTTKPAAEPASPKVRSWTNILTLGLLG